MELNRRDFLGLLGSSLAIAPIGFASEQKSHLSASSLKLSLSQWSFHRAILGNSKEDYDQFIRALHTSPDSVLAGNLDPRDICKISSSLEIPYVDLVNTLFFGHHSDLEYLKDFNKRADDNGVSFQLLMCDECGSLGAESSSERQASINSHLRWLEAAAILGCKQLRVNAYGEGSYLQQLNRCAESLHRLSNECESYGVELLVENHGHASNNAAWLAMLIENVNHPNLGLFTDLDNFFLGGWNITPERRYDRTQGIIDLAPYTRGVSVKAHDFDSAGNEVTIDYKALFSILTHAGFNGKYSIEYEGDRLSELEGTLATKLATEKALL
ncbi:sugar phosphate isomerase/epimerase family protein [Alteromonas stellipolaris]|uniref:sugar phosphate isomerase/epimerase family protein n=1 Tax=Alteromonas TaxID=226 RepID=UPI0007702F67|nr:MULTISPECIES: sugar phosphate isomerase/epimerase family protein [Alteromonas]AMJ87271.1 hypothetical protein AV939_12245 [Alteromonas sp. Mac1]AMJ91133.1 hypothetical protein AV940_12005 [Alteromonas sp. Mac2]ANB24122.1 hypothetical protein A6F57_02185 [Alteromonas stellipolaris]MDO6539246.1 sugar phosphate isomerase/epimerase family protein [Alteromonas stellipolaris]